MYSFAYLFIYVFICSIIWELTSDQVLLFFLRPTKTSTVSAFGELMFWQRTKSDITCFRRNVGQDMGSTQSLGSVLLGELAFQIRSLRAALGGQLVFPGHGGTDRGVPPAEEFIEHERTHASDGHATACATGEVMKGVLPGWGVHSQKPLSSKAISAFCFQTPVCKSPGMTIENPLGPPGDSYFDSVRVECNRSNSCKVHGLRGDCG